MIYSTHTERACVYMWHCRMREHKHITEIKGAYLSSSDDVKSKVRLVVGFWTHFLKDGRKKEREKNT